MLKRGSCSSRRIIAVAAKRPFFFNLLPTKDVAPYVPPSYEKFPPAPRPEGVPDTWQAHYIDTDQGHFEDDCFPPALEGESLEEYCRRVPNIWSPCSRSTDVVDVRVSTTLEWALDPQPDDHQFSERPVLKIPPLDSDWHDANEIENMLADPPGPFTINGVIPPEWDPDDLAEVHKIVSEGAARVGYGHWFESDNFADFWVELTGKEIGEMNYDRTLKKFMELNPGRTMEELEAAWVPNKDDPWFSREEPPEKVEERKLLRLAFKQHHIDAAEREKAEAQAIDDGAAGKGKIPQ